MKNRFITMALFVFFGYTTQTFGMSKVPTSAQSFHLSALPVELQEKVLTYLNTPEDLKSFLAFRSTCTSNNEIILRQFEGDLKWKDPFETTYEQIAKLLEIDQKDWNLKEILDSYKPKYLSWRKLTSMLKQYHHVNLIEKDKHSFEATIFEQNSASEIQCHFCGNECCNFMHRSSKHNCGPGCVSCITATCGAFLGVGLGYWVPAVGHLWPLTAAACGVLGGIMPDVIYIGVQCAPHLYDEAKKCHLIVKAKNAAKVAHDLREKYTHEYSRIEHDSVENSLMDDLNQLMKDPVLEVVLLFFQNKPSQIVIQEIESDL